MRGLTVVGIFLCFGATMASLAGTTLIWRGTPLDRIWSLNVEAYRELEPLGRIVGIVFLALAVALAAAATGWFRRRLWGWRLAVGIIATQILGDLANLLRGDFLRGGAGCVIASALLFYLLRPQVRVVFTGKGSVGTSVASEDC
jgi:hypothetical protein